MTRDAYSAVRSAKIFSLKQNPSEEIVAASKLQQLGVDTPCVLVSQKELDLALDRFSTHLPDVELFYAVKANSSDAVLKHFVVRELSFDVASAQEIRELKALGVSGSKMILSHPVKDSRSIKEMISHRVAAFTVDSAEELDKIVKFPRDYIPDVFVRIRTESEDVQIDLNEKYGCRLSDAAGILKHAADLGFNPIGVTFHVGTQSYLASNYQTGLDHCLVVAEQVMRRYGIKLTTFNIGGGFCDRNVAAQHGTTIDAVFAEIGAVVREVANHGFRIIAEPGRCLVTHAGSLVCRVIGMHNRGGAKLVHIDDGVYGVLSGQMFDHRVYDFECLPRTASREDYTEEQSMVRVCGRTCDSIDMMNGVHPLPTNLAIDDLLMVRNVGAYGSATASKFNGFATAESYLFAVHNGQITFPQLDAEIERATPAVSAA